MKRLVFATGTALCAIALAAPAHAQESEEGRTQRTTVQPYIEVNQIGVVTLSPDEDGVTYTQIAAGVDASVTGRNTGGTVSIRSTQSRSPVSGFTANTRMPPSARGWRPAAK